MKNSDLQKLREQLNAGELTDRSVFNALIDEIENLRWANHHLTRHIDTLVTAIEAANEI